MSNENMVVLAIPTRHYAKVIKYLADLYSAEDSKHPTEVRHDADDDGNFLPEVLGWSKSEIRELKVATNKTTRAIFDLANERNGDAVNYQEIVDRSGRTPKQVAADLSGLSRTSTGRFKKGAWPIQTSGVQPTDGVSTYAYKIPRQYLDWWFES